MGAWIKAPTQATRYGLKVLSSEMSCHFSFPSFSSLLKNSYLSLSFFAFSLMSDSIYRREFNETNAATAVNTAIRENQMSIFPQVVAPLADRPKLSHGRANRLPIMTAEKTPYAM